jgi:hypothetical protein
MIFFTISGLFLCSLRLKGGTGGFGRGAKIDAELRACALMVGLTHPEFQQLILDLKFLALQFKDATIILPRMMLLFGDFFLERLVATLEFDDMTLQGHAKPPF